MNLESFNFEKYLSESVHEYQGSHKNSINALPDLYKFLENSLQDDDLAYSLRNDIYVTFGYLFYPHDLYSEEEHGPIGFVDDLMLILFVINKIEQNHGQEFIKKHWVCEQTIKSLLIDEFNLLKSEFDDLFIDVLTQISKKAKFKKDSLAVLRVKNLSGGNYWGHPTDQGIAKCINELAGNHFANEFRGGLINHINEAY